MVHSALHPLLLPLSLVSKGCSRPEFPALIHENQEVTVSRIQNLAQVMSPTGLSTTRPFLSRRLCILLLNVRLPKSRSISNLCPTTSHCCLPLKILFKAVPRLKKQTLTTNKFVLCWLHHDIYQSEKQVRNDRKFITLNEKAWCPVHLQIRSLS